MPEPTSSTTTPCAGSCQLLMVIADNWHATTAALQRWARDTVDQPWQAVGTAIPVTLGRQGMAWGLGLHGAAPQEGRIKREGDGCAPAGVFTLRSIFGEVTASGTFASRLKLPYQEITPHLFAIDDPGSIYYNRIVDRRNIATPDWNSAEDMQRTDQRYVFGVEVGHNTKPEPGAGSCIFIHVWEQPGVSTAGCTAGALREITELVQWLDGSCLPLLVQLPASEYARHKAAWALPG